MIACQKFLWIHVMKTGGHWIRHHVLPALPADWDVTDIYRHVPLSEARRDYPDVPSWACIRNPWAWYLSMHAFMFQHWWDQTGSFALPRDEQPERARIWGAAFELGDRFEQLLPRMVAGDGFESYTGHVTRLTGAGTDQEVDRFVRYEDLRQGVEQTLTEFCGELPPPLLEAIRHGSPSNTSRHGPVRGYYTGTLAQLVAEGDRELIERFHYQLP